MATSSSTYIVSDARERRSSRSSEHTAHTVIACVRCSGVVSGSVRMDAKKSVLM
jgi:cation transport regulator ChaB